jgi:hypothetical protein
VRKRSGLVASLQGDGLQVENGARGVEV